SDAETKDWDDWEFTGQKATVESYPTMTTTKVDPTNVTTNVEPSMNAAIDVLPTTDTTIETDQIDSIENITTKSNIEENLTADSIGAVYNDSPDSPSNNQSTQQQTEVQYTGRSIIPWGFPQVMSQTQHSTNM
ncbi:hypothetical protein BGZ76_006982, partial [Entomortierella beljakovae]